MSQQVTAQELGPTLTVEYLKELERKNRWENLGRGWYRFSRNPLSIFGLVTVLAVILLAIFAPAQAVAELLRLKQDFSTNCPFLIGCYVKFDDLAFALLDGLRKAGLKI